MKPEARLAVLFLVLTVALGVALRWEFVTGQLAQIGLLFPNVRHAHSHGGYYGLLMLPLFEILRNAGVPISVTGIRLYSACALAAVVLFVFTGYGLATIVLSTAVLGFWLYVCRQKFRGGYATGSWLDVTPWGILLGSIFIPAIAVMTKRDAALAVSLAHLFLSLLLLGAFVPASWSALGIGRKVPVAAVLAIVGGAAVQYSFPELLGRAGGIFIVAYAVLIAGVVREMGQRRVLQGYWALLVVLLAGSVVFPELNDNAARIAGIHFVILGPVFSSFAIALAPGVLKIPRFFLGSYVLLLLAMVGCIVAGPLFWPVQAALVTAVVSSLFAANLMVCLGWVVVSGRGRPSHG